MAEAAKSIDSAALQRQADTSSNLPVFYAVQGPLLGEQKNDGNESRHAQSLEPWPVNEMVLHQLVCAGLDNAEIAAKYCVTKPDVEALIELYASGAACSSLSWD